jgi:hypothetical protein
MDANEERDYDDQVPLSDMDMEEDAEILATLLKHIPSCTNADDIEQLLQDIPVQPPVVAPVRLRTSRRQRPRALPAPSRPLAGRRRPPHFNSAAGLPPPRGRPTRPRPRPHHPAR